MGISMSIGERRCAGGFAVGVAFLLSAVAAPGASGATLGANAPCYRFTTSTPPTMVVTGSGYVPGDIVNVTSNVGFVDATATADAGGHISVSTTAPRPPKIGAGAQSVLLTADDASIHGPITATAPVSVAYLYVFHGGAKKRPGLGAFREKTRWAFSGFTPGKPIWGHYIVRHRQVARVHFGKANGPCGVLTTRAKLFPATPHFRTYPVQVDDFKRYSSDSFPKVTGRLRLTTVL